MAFDPTAAAEKRRQSMQNAEQDALEQMMENAENFSADLIIKITEMMNRLDINKPTFESDAQSVTEKFTSALQALDMNTPAPAPAKPPASPPQTVAAPVPPLVAPASQPSTDSDQSEAEPQKGSTKADSKAESAKDKSKGIKGWVVSKAKELDENSKVKEKTA